MITSSHNPKVQLARALLGRAKERREKCAFVVEGVRLVEEAVNAGWPIRFVLYDETLNERGKSNVESLRSRGIETELISTNVMKSLSDTETSQGLLAVLDLPAPDSPLSTLYFPLPTLYSLLSTSSSSPIRFAAPATWERCSAPQRPPAYRPY